MLIFLILILFAINYNFFDEKIKDFLDESETGVVERVVDGDTIIVNNESVRLLGINTPERGELYYQEAKDFLEMILSNKTIQLKFGKDRYDLYGRKLAYVFRDSHNVNKEMVDEGYANCYFPSGKDTYYSSFLKAWGHCLTNNKYLCEKSTNECVDCIELKEFDVKNQQIIFYNKCDFSCNLNDWTIKDEGRKKLVFSKFVLENKRQVEIRVGEGIDNNNRLFWTKEDYVWTSTGDTLFLRDEEGKLVLWKSY